MSDNHHDDYQPAYRGMLEEISNDEELDRRVMARVHDLRSGQQETEGARRVTGRQASATRRDPRPRSSVCTRRAIVTAGAAIAGCALLGVAVPAGRRFFGDDQTQPATRRDTPESTIPTTSGSAQNDAGAHSFGLAVAMANEPDSSGRTSFELASTAEGLLPMVTGDARVSQYTHELHHRRRRH